MLFITTSGDLKEIQKKDFLRDDEYYEKIHDVVFKKKIYKRNFEEYVKSIMEENNGKINTTKENPKVVI